MIAYLGVKVVVQLVCVVAENVKIVALDSFAHEQITICAILSLGRKGHSDPWIVRIRLNMELLVTLKGHVDSVVLGQVNRKGSSTNRIGTPNVAAAHWAKEYTVGGIREGFIKVTGWFEYQLKLLGLR